MYFSCERFSQEMEKPREAERPSSSVCLTDHVCKWEIHVCSSSQHTRHKPENHIFTLKVEFGDMEVEI